MRASCSSESNWFEAKEALNRLRPKLAEMGFGRSDGNRLQHRPVLREVRPAGPGDRGRTSWCCSRIRKTSRRTGRAAQRRCKRVWSRTTARRILGRRLVAIELKKPKEQRDWNGYGRHAAGNGEEQKWDEANLNIRQAQLMTMREDFDGARKMLKEANESYPQQSADPSDDGSTSAARSQGWSRQSDADVAIGCQEI